MARAIVGHAFPNIAGALSPPRLRDITVRLRLRSGDGRSAASEDQQQSPAADSRSPLPVSSWRPSAAAHRGSKGPAPGQQLSVPGPDEPLAAAIPSRTVPAAE